MRMKMNISLHNVKKIKVRREEMMRRGTENGLVSRARDIFPNVDGVGVDDVEGGFDVDGAFPGGVDEGGDGGGVGVYGEGIGGAGGADSIQFEGSCGTLPNVPSL
jgi:hypothetical protein